MCRGSVEEFADTTYNINIFHLTGPADKYQIFCGWRCRPFVYRYVTLMMTLQQMAEVTTLCPELIITYKIDICLSRTRHHLLINLSLDP